MKLIGAVMHLAAVVFIALPLACIGMLLAVTGGVMVGVAKIVMDRA